jgi:hypothetical protein
MWILRKIVFISITAILTVFTINFIKSDSIEISNKYIYGPYKSYVRYEQLTNNTGKSSREVINNVWYNLNKENYELVSINEDSLYVDVIFQKDSDIWRYVYDKESDYVMFFNNKYETSYNGESYINEGKGNK